MLLRLAQALTALAVTVIITACSPSPPRPLPVSFPQGTSGPPSTSTITTTTGSSVPATPTVLTDKSGPDLLLDASWQIQYSGELDLSLNVDVYNLDLFEASPDDIANLRERGIYVMCYFSAGAWEDWRPDAEQFPGRLIGNDYEGWAGEKWLDVRDIQALAPVMESRIRLAAEKGCDGVDPDNVNGFENETGFPISYDDQLSFNLWLAQTAHSYGLEIGLKNDLAQIHELMPFFDWALNEECFSYNDCELLSPFRASGKPVFVIEYETETDDFCPQAQELGFNAIFKNWELDAYRETCP